MVFDGTFFASRRNELRYPLWRVTRPLPVPVWRSSQTGTASGRVQKLSSIFIARVASDRVLYTTQAWRKSSEGHVIQTIKCRGISAWRKLAVVEQHVEGWAISAKFFLSLISHTYICGVIFSKIWLDWTVEPPEVI